MARLRHWARRASLSSPNTILPNSSHDASMVLVSVGKQVSTTNMARSYRRCYAGKLASARAEAKLPSLLFTMCQNGRLNVATNQTLSPFSKIIMLITKIFWTNLKARTNDLIIVTIAWGLTARDKRSASLSIPTYRRRNKLVAGKS